MSKIRSCFRARCWIIEECEMGSRRGCAVDEDEGTRGRLILHYGRMGFESGARLRVCL